MKKMKLSKYNYYYEKEEESIICMNLISKIMFGLEREKFELIKNNSNNIDNLKLENPNLYSALVKLGIIIEEDFDEISFLTTEHRKQIYSPNFYRLTIVPTLECNFNCWYCYEEKPKGQMNTIKVRNIERLVRKTLQNDCIKHFQLDWFGGEPLIAFDNTLYPLSVKIKNICAKNNIEFSSSITTNGALLTDEIIHKFKKINLNSFQITLDGNEEYHNKVKKGNSTDNVYKITVSNILKLIDILENPNILLRINFTPQNLKKINQIIHDIPNKYRKKIEVSFQQVWQTQKDNSSLELSPCNNDFLDAGFIAPLYKIDGKFYKCYADLYHQSVIDLRGNVFKCTARDFINHNPDGVLNNDGTIKWNNIFYNRMSRTTIENEFCLQCTLLPACWGPCSQKIIETNVDDFNKICNKSGIINTLTTLMDNFYTNKIINKQNLK